MKKILDILCPYNGEPIGSLNDTARSIINKRKSGKCYFSDPIETADIINKPKFQKDRNA